MSVTREVCVRHQFYKIVKKKKNKKQLALFMGRDWIVKNSGGRHSWDKNSVSGDRYAFLLSWRWVPKLFRSTESTPTNTLHKPSQEAPVRAELGTSFLGC